MVRATRCFYKLPYCGSKGLTVKGFLFDLDGTLVDTAIDMLRALKLLAQENSIEIEPNHAQYKELITHGSRAIVESIFGKTDQKTFLKLQKRYLEIYQDILTQGSCLFDGVEDFIQALDKQKIPWGIVTNKPHYLAKPLVKSLKPLENCGILVGGDSTKFSKPHPQPINTAIQMLKINPKKSWYIGDALSDITAGNAANMQTAVALWGYIGTNDSPEKWQATKTVQQPLELFKL